MTPRRIVLSLVVPACTLALLGAALSLTATAAATAAATPAPASLPERLKRADSFLGIHFDFHAGPDCTEVGKNTTRPMIEHILDRVRPDYLQIDCKGHRGYSSYPTQVGCPVPGFVGDPLRLWREVTAERGVALYMHYSGVWDSEAILRHPEWAAVNADGKPNDRATSFWSPYADRLLIPQLRELAGEYGVDGAWIDGECWASVPDYGAAAAQAFRDATGLTELPRRGSDPHRFDFMQFHREAFRKYLRYYVAEVKRTHPGFQLCSNWAFTDHMPEPVSVPVDFLSGDYSPDDSVNSARLSARYLARQGKPWDLMAWSFSQRARAGGGSSQKTAVQLQREAALVLALGGGFQAYFKQKRDGSIYDEQMLVMAEVARFCRERQAICHHAEPVPQVALLFSTPAHYRKCSGLFSRELAPLHGNLQALLESQHSVEVLGEHHLTGRLAEYPLVIVPEWEYLEPPFQAELVAYVQEGGNLLLVGPGSAALFDAELGVTRAGGVQTQPLYLAHRDAQVATIGPTQRVVAKAGTRVFGELQADASPAPGAGSQPAATIAALGRGRIAATWFTFGQGYLKDHSAVRRGFLRELVRELMPRPLVEVRGSGEVDVVVNRQGGRLAVNLVNTGGPHREAGILEAIPALGPLEVTIRRPRRPARVTVEPGGRPVEFAYRDGAVQLTLPRLELHDIVVVE